MTLFLGLDVGTTTLSVVILEAPSGALLAHTTLPHTELTATGERARGHAELDLLRLQPLIVRALAETVAQVGVRHGEIGGIGVTGQQHGVALLAPDGAPLRPAITWQDRRALETLPGTTETYLERFVSLAGGPRAFERMGCLPATGYLGPSLFWLRQNGQLPAPPALACFIPDAAVAFLTGRVPSTDPTDGGSSALLDLVTRQWDTALLARLGLPAELLPPVVETGTLAGPLHPALAHQTGLPAGTPVFVALGDNQASFLGSVRDPESSLLLNVGTGAQISGVIAGFERRPGLDTRYFPGGRYLLVGAGLFGGQSYACLRDFFRQVGRDLFGQEPGAALYDELTRLAAVVPPGADGLTFRPLFYGTRQDPQARASLSGLNAQNFTPGHLARALLEGVAELFFEFYATMRPLLGERQTLVGSGNALRRNPLLAVILAARFASPLHIPAQEEEAATGAALVAGVGAGAWLSLADATRRLCYET